MRVCIGRILTAVLLVVLPVAAIGQQISSEDTLKVAFLYNFIKLTEWPQEALRDKLHVCLAGDGVFAEALQQLHERDAHGTTIAVEVLERSDEARRCQLLFIPDELGTAQKSWLRAVKGAKVLTVGDGEHFIDAGGIIGLVIVEQRLRFEINLTAAHDNKLHLSAQLLQLARRIEGTQP